jgi:protein-tyrosine phosphatase
MHIITDSLLVGNLDDAQDPSPAIGGLLFVAEEHAVSPPDLMDFAKIPFKEFAQPDPRLLAKTVQWIEDHLPNNRVMVCCRAGMGRSVSVVIAYLCCAQGMAYDDAVKLAKTRRPGAMPLPGLQEAIEEVRRLRELQPRKKAGPRSDPKPRCA